jgi:hypothetical protein
MATKAVLAAKFANHQLDIEVPNSKATIHVWWLYITLIMGAVFGFAEHSLCVAWAATFRGDSWIEMSHYRGSFFAQRRSLSPAREPLLPPVATTIAVASPSTDADHSDPLG